MHTLEYMRRPSTVKPPFPILGVLSCITAIVGSTILWMPSVLDAVGSIASVYSMAGAMMAVSAMLRRERAPGFALLGGGLHLISILTWWNIGGWAYFGEGP